MHKAVKDNNLGLLCLLNILGGHWKTNVAKYTAESVVDVFLHKMNNEGLALTDVNPVTKWWIGKAAGTQCMVHSTAANGMLKSLEILVSNKADVNARRREDGFAPLHCAVQVPNLSN